jgi:hypothetical protein
MCVGLDARTDTLNQLQTLTPPAAFTSTGNFGFPYDALSRRRQMTRPSTAAKAALRQQNQQLDLVGGCNAINPRDFVVRGPCSIP